MKERKLNRLNGYDYNKQGYYFITINTYNGECSFGNIENDIMHLSQKGKIAKEIWFSMSEHYEYIELDEYIIMSNHIHGIIIVNGDFVGNAGLRSGKIDTDRSKMMLSKSIHGFKSTVTRKIRKDLNDFNFSWHKSFYDHVIRNEYDLNRIREYIINNPANWLKDKKELL